MADEKTDELPPPQINVRLRFQVNLGNYNLLTSEFGCTDYKRPSDASTSAAYDRVFNLVNDKAQEKINEVKAELTNK